MKKRCMALTLAAVMAFSVTAFGASNPAQNGKWESAYGSGTVSAEKEMYQTLDRSILCADVTFALPENAQGKNLYLAMVDTEDWLSDGKAGFLPGSLEEWENNDLKQILNPNEQQIFTVPLTKDLLDLNVVYDGERKDGKSISLVALGGSQYADNLFAEYEDQLLVQDLISLYYRPDYKNEIEMVPCTIDVTIGADIMQVDGKSYPLDVPAYINDAGYTMLPMRALVENLPEEVQKKVIWDGQQRTALLLCGMTTYRLTDGQKEAEKDGQLWMLKSPLEIKEGRVFLPLREIVTFWDQSNIQWENETKTVHISADMVHFLE